MITMECKEVCIPGEVQAPYVWKKNCARICLCFADCLYDCKCGATEGKKKSEGRESKLERCRHGGESRQARRSEGGKARTLAILSPGSLTAAGIAVGNLLLFQTG